MLDEVGGYGVKSQQREKHKWELTEDTTMKKWLVAVPVAAAAAVGAALALKGKPGAEKKPAAVKSSEKPAAKAGGKKNAEFSFKNPTSGVYSFASGYKDAKEVTVTVTYDADKHAFGVVSEGYITDSGDSHVAIINTDDFSMQIEYAPYYHGEDFAALERSVAENYKNFGKVSFKNVDGICFTNGGSYCMAFPAADSTSDYVLTSVVLMGDDSEDERIKLRSNPEMLAIMDTLVIE